MLEIYFGESGTTPLSKSLLSKNELYCFNQDFSIGDLQNVNVDINIDSEKNIRIWSSKINVQEYLNFLYICYKFKGKNISVIFTDNYKKDVYSVGSTTFEEIPAMLKYEKKLNINEINEYKNEWLRIIKYNNQIRCFYNKKIICTDFKYFDEYLKNNYNDNINIWIANLMANDETNNYSSNVYKILIDNYNKNK